jgi:hypothetical protein
VDLEGLASDKFMEIVDAWPQTRVNILEQTRLLLNARFARTSRTIGHVSDWFAALQTLVSGEYGDVFKGCVRAWELTTGVPLSPPACVQYTVSDIDSAAHDVFLIVKTIAPLTVPLLNDVPFAGHTPAFDDWYGETNPVREVMMGRLLNLLVVHGVTPHFPLIYEPFQIADTRRTGFAMELAHMSLTNFLSSKILAALSPRKAVELLDVALLQLCNGLLCAHKHYDFRHNDFHSDNAMMTFITDSTYSYMVGDAFYTIPNYGMCWKLIDFGQSASRVFGAEDVPHAVMHSPSLSVVNTYFDLSDHAMEFYDLLRLVTTARNDVEVPKKAAKTKKAVVNRLDAYVDAMRAIARKSTKRGSLQAAYAAYVENDRRSRATLLRPRNEFSRLMRSSGLLEQFFHHLGAKYRVPKKPRGKVFDANSSPFDGGAIVLEGVHTRPIVVTLT